MQVKVTARSGRVYTYEVGDPAHAMWVCEDGALVVNWQGYLCRYEGKGHDRAEWIRAELIGPDDEIVETLVEG